jgi:hypothetical protein
MLERTIIAAFTTRNTIPFLAFLLVAIYLIRSEPKDITELAHRLINSELIATLGWTLFCLTFFTAWKLLSWQEVRYREEIERLEKVKNLAIKGQLELPLDKEQT